MTNKLRNNITVPDTMKSVFNRLLLLSIVAFALQNHTQPIAAQTRHSASRFQGSWNWEYYLTKEDLRDFDVEQFKRWAEGMDIRKTPFETLDVKITQRGNKLTGECFSLMRFIDRVDGCEFSTRIKRGVAQFKVESSHGSIVTVRLTERRNRLYWKVVKSEGDGEYWFPDKAILRRDQKKLATHRGRKPH
jgi:hypothetical protein